MAEELLSRAHDERHLQGQTYGIPFQRSTIVLYWNKAAFKEAGLDPEKPPTNWNEMRDMAAKLVKKDAAGNVPRWGVMVPSTGYPYWMFQALWVPERPGPDEPGGQPHELHAPATVAASSTGRTSVGSIGSCRRDRRLGDAPPAVPRGQDRDDVAHHREPDRGERPAPVPLRRGHAARLQQRGCPPGAATSTSSRRPRPRSARPRSSSSSGSPRRSARRTGRSTPATSRLGRTPTTRRS